MLKAELVRRIAILVDTTPLTQAEAAERMAMSQSDVSKMLRGGFRPLSLEKLMQCLVALGQTFTIDIAKPTRTVPSIRIAPSRAAPRKRA